TNGFVIASYGRPAGRRYGIFNPLDFAGLLDICADGQGGFFTSEEFPRRIAHFGLTASSAGLLHPSGERLVGERDETLSGYKFCRLPTQGSSFLATLGWRTQSRWDCKELNKHSGEAPLQLLGQ